MGRRDRPYRGVGALNCIELHDSRQAFPTSDDGSAEIGGSVASLRSPLTCRDLVSETANFVKRVGKNSNLARYLSRRPPC